jgi:hypothetical protein
MNVKQCPNCKSIYDLQVAVCGTCNHVFRTQFPPPDKTQVFNAPSLPQPNSYQTPAYGMICKPKGMHSVPTALILSFLFSVGGQIYNEQYLKALVMFLVLLGFSIATCGIACLFLWPVCVIDAYCIANKLNQGKPVGKWEFF